MKLVVIEGPGKKDAIKKYLGEGYEVFATKGHVRDLPIHAFGIDIKNDFEPRYEILPDKKGVISSLKKVASKADSIYLATDPDREGEAISWHVANVLELNPNDPVRIEFNEISKNAVNQAIQKPRAIDGNLVDAQQARRVVDRIVGYKLSPILCKKIQPKLSAGRVQSVTLKLVVDREREIINFKPEEWWAITSSLSKTDGKTKPFNATLSTKNGKKIKIKSAAEKDAFLSSVDGLEWKVASIKKIVTKSHAPAPYITSSMQQDALNKLGMNLKRTTMAAQNLYEGVEIAGKGKTALITYIRTDSVRVSPEAQSAAREYIVRTFGDKFCPEKPNIFKSKKSAQDAHEAIRPIYMDVRPDDVKASLSADNYKLYKLIYERFLASQMSDATYNSVALDVAVGDYTFKATGRTPIFAGYTIVYTEYEAKDKDEDETISAIPPLEEGEVLKLNGIKADQKFTKPPARYTEASLVKAMEEKGIGRPATYTPTVTILFNRNYIELEGKSMKPTELGFAVTDLLTEHFPKIMNIEFTAQMEDSLDDIASGEKNWKAVIDKFYTGFKETMDKASEALKTFVEESDEVCDKCGSKMVIRMGRFGKFLACSNYPTCKNVKNIDENGEESSQLSDEICPECGAQMTIKMGKFGRFLACSNYPTCTYKKNFGENPSVVETSIKCSKCGHTMVERVGKFGKFLACSNYPNCKNIMSVNKKLGECPLCHKDIIERRNKKGDIFYGCTGYPQCNMVYKDPPSGEKCAKCGSDILVRQSNTYTKEYCANPNCDYSKIIKKGQTD